VGGSWHLDTTTLMMTAALITPLIAAANGFLWRQTRDPALLWWGGGSVVMAVGPVIAMLGDGRVALSMLGGIGIVVSHWMFYRGIRELHESRPLPGEAFRRRADRVLLSVLAGSYPLALALDVHLLNPIVVSLAAAVLSGLCAHALIFCHGGQARASSLYTGAIFACNALLQLVAATTALWLGEGTVNWQLDQAAIVFLLVGWSFGFLMLIGQRNQERMAALADEDLLTGANTRRALLEKGQHLFAMAARQGPQLGVLMLDLDHFKDVNDTYGHAAGDRVLQRFATVVRECLRGSDVFGRLGGEEFCILLPDTAIEGTMHVAERIRATFGEVPVDTGTAKVRCTVSIGATVYDERVDELGALIARADNALYEAKHQGRDRVVAATATERAAPLVQLVWDSRFKSGHPVIDREHEYLFGWANALLGKMQSSADHTAIEGDVREMLHWLGEHFRHEEEILAQMNWTGLERHMKQHRGLEERGAQLLAEVVAGKRNFAELLDFVVLEVVARHLSRHDAQYFPLMKAA
jgi:diguanylate cyclase (GGDEF)-like protein/hemerythrin-like metal-binding protein